MPKIGIILLVVVAGIGVLIALGIAVLAILARVAKSPVPLGVRDGKLAPCPSSPNCVSTQQADEAHLLAPIPYETSLDEAREALLRVIRSMERTTVVTVEPTYIHAEFRTTGLRYVDDVEFYLDEEAQVVHFRSASRLPYWDWGVNEERMRVIREEFEKEGE